MQNARQGSFQYKQFNEGPDQPENAHSWIRACTALDQGMSTECINEHRRPASDCVDKEAYLDLKAK